MLSQREGYICDVWVEARDIVKHPTMHRIAPYSEVSAPTWDSVKFEKP